MCWKLERGTLRAGNENLSRSVGPWSTCRRPRKNVFKTSQVFFPFRNSSFSAAKLRCYRFSAQGLVLLPNRPPRKTVAAAEASRKDKVLLWRKFARGKGRFTLEVGGLDVLGDWLSMFFPGNSCWDRSAGWWLITSWVFSTLDCSSPDRPFDMQFMGYEGLRLEFWPIAMWHGRSMTKHASIFHMFALIREPTGLWPACYGHELGFPRRHGLPRPHCTAWPAQESRPGPRSTAWTSHSSMAGWRRAVCPTALPCRAWSVAWHWDEQNWPPETGWCG